MPSIEILGGGGYRQLFLREGLKLKSGTEVSLTTGILIHTGYVILLAGYIKVYISVSLSAS